MIRAAARTTAASALAALLLLSACGDDAPPPPADPVWSVAQEELPGALLSVSPAGGGYAVGGDGGAGPMVLRREGDAWATVATGASGALWWVTPDGADLLMVGEGGLALGHAPGTDTFTPVVTGTTHTLFGAWVSADGTAWAVGGDVRADTGRGVLLVRRGGAWAPDERADPALFDAAMLFKVWGTSATDLWVVGEGGVVLRFDGSAWAAVDSGTTARLLTVHGAPGVGPYAVGGLSNGVILEWDGAAFADRAPELLPAYNGVFVQSAERAFAVGNTGLLSVRAGSVWGFEESPPTARDLHAVMADEAGLAFAVGGALASPALDRGVLLRYGPP